MEGKRAPVARGQKELRFSGRRWEDPWVIEGLKLACKEQVMVRGV
jgi:hypothetical protein